MKQSKQTKPKINARIYRTAISSLTINLFRKCICRNVSLQKQRRIIYNSATLVNYLLHQTKLSCFCSLSLCSIHLESVFHRSKKQNNFKAKNINISHNLFAIKRVLFIYNFIFFEVERETNPSHVFSLVFLSIFYGWKSFNEKIPHQIKMQDYLHILQ